MIAALLAKETRKGFLLPRPLKINDTTERLLPFYQSLPGVGLGTALLLAASFRSAADLTQAALVTIMRKANMDQVKAAKIHEYLRRRFQKDGTEIGKL